jgi:hypothetical protein
MNLLKLFKDGLKKGMHKAAHPSGGVNFHQILSAEGVGGSTICIGLVVVTCNL